MRRFIVQRLGVPASLAIGIAATVVPVIGTTWFVWNQELFQESQPEATDRAANSELIALQELPNDQRVERLEALAKTGDRQNRNRARYLLADLWLEQKQGNKALAWLKGLEKTYPVLAPEILQKRGQAYQLAGKTAQATATWKDLLDQYPQSPVAAEALYALGQDQPRYWDQAIAEFPAHPRTVAIAQQRLQSNPDQFPLLLLVARHGLYLPEITEILDRLVAQYSDQLQPADWQAIAFGYWETLNYGKAGAAYARAPQTALTTYRAGRGLQLGQANQKARQAYQQLVTQFPKTEEAVLGWLQLASLAEQPTETLSYLERALQLARQLDLPNQAGKALLRQADLLVRQDQPQAASQVRQQLLSRHGSTEAAAELRWRLAQERAAAQDFETAQRWSWQIAQDNPDSELAPQATFWAGKWASKRGEQAAAQRAFQQVLSNYPASYYGWRVASLSGWPVGSFDQVRSLNPPIQPLPQRLDLPAGSEAVQELYRMGQDQEAWTRWQWSFQNRPQPTPEEQLTDGLLRLGVGDYLDGLFMVENVADRAQEDPKIADRYQGWRQQPGYRQALYPLPYLDAIQALAQQRSLNPLLVMALIRQESRFEKDIGSVVGARGLMQVMPETADWIASQIGLETYALDQPQDNLLLGIWYLDYTHRTYDNHSLLAIASYNAGPGNVAAWVEEFGSNDPDAFVEAIPFPETKDYVKAVFANYWNYLQLYNPEVAQRVKQEGSKNSGSALKP